MNTDYLCEDYGEIKIYNQIRATADIYLDRLCEIMSAFEPNIQIEDYSDIDLKSTYGDLIDEKLLAADKSKASVSVYIAENEKGNTLAGKIKKALAALDFECVVETRTIKEQDWANNWREYYKPIKIGKKNNIIPAWFEQDTPEGEIALIMDPGMAFGTGSHETTRLVIELIEKHLVSGMRAADVGTGSGILAICAAKLGAGEVHAYDIDPSAVKIAAENCEKNGVSHVRCSRSDLLAQADLSGGKFDIIFANIVADILIRMTPETPKVLNPGGIFILSGIIDTRAEDVIFVLERTGYCVIERKEEGGWCAIAAKLVK